MFSLRYYFISFFIIIIFYSFIQWLIALEVYIFILFYFILFIQQLVALKVYILFHF